MSRSVPAYSCAAGSLATTCAYQNVSLDEKGPQGGLSPALFSTWSVGLCDCSGVRPAHVWSLKKITDISPVFLRAWLY